MSMVGIGDKCRRPRLLLAESGLGANVRYWPKAAIAMPLKKQLNKRDEGRICLS